MLQSLQAIFDAIPHPIAVGCAAIALGFVLAGLASAIYANAHKIRNSRKQETKRKFRRLRLVFVALLILGGILTGGGTWLTIRGGREDAEIQSKAAMQALDAKLQMVLLALNAAKQEQNRLLTEERLKVIGSDLPGWVEDFSKRRPDKQRQLEQAKVARRQKEIQISSESAPVFSLTLKFVEELVRAYAKQSNADIKITLPPFPENYYDGDPKNTERYIIFGGSSSWRFLISAAAPANEDNPPQLIIHMYDAEGRVGVVYVRCSPKTNRFSISGSGNLPLPEATSMFQDYDLGGFEQAIRRVFQRFLEAQLLEAPPTASPSPSVGKT